MIIERKVWVDAVEYYQLEIGEVEVEDLNKEIVKDCIDGFFFEPLTLEDIKLLYGSESTSTRDIDTNGETIILKRNWGNTPSYEYDLRDYVLEFFNDMFYDNYVGGETRNSYDVETYVIKN